jgi:hypothetical protein
MKVICDETYQFLRDSYERVIQDLLDDPTGAGLTTAQLNEWYETLVVVGKNCELDFWEVAKQEGTDYEITRFKRLLAGLEEE